MTWRACCPCRCHQHLGVSSAVQCNCTLSGNCTLGCIMLINGVDNVLALPCASERVSQQRQDLSTGLASRCASERVLCGCQGPTVACFWSNPFVEKNHCRARRCSRTPLRIHHTSSTSHTPADERRRCLTRPCTALADTRPRPALHHIAHACRRTTEPGASNS